MGFFKKKADPISERAKALNDQIAALEAEIQRLSAEREPDERNHAAPPPPPAPPLARKETRPPSAQPKLRSTTLPHGHGGSTMHAQTPETSPESGPVEEPVLEDLNPFRDPSEAVPPVAPKPSLGLRGPESVPVWERIKNNFRGPATSNPKLVNYLAAGSIQGLRPLRYEKRVARNRFLLFAIALALVLWGLLAAFFKR
jgi:hypothetical protein